MPVHTIVREEFADAIKAASGGLSPGQLSIKTGISDVYIYKMLGGRVPSVSVIHKFASGMGIDARPLMIAAGYELAPPAQRAADAMKELDIEQRVNVFLNGSEDLPDHAKEQIREMVLEAWRKKKEQE